MTNEMMLNATQLFYNCNLINEKELNDNLLKYDEIELNTILRSSKRFFYFLDTMIKKEILIEFYHAINTNKYNDLFYFELNNELLKLDDDDFNKIQSSINGIDLQIIAKGFNYLKNYDGIITTLLEFFKNCPEITEKELTQLIKNLLITSPNQTEQLNKINEGGLYFFNLLVLSIQKILIENNKISINSKERLYSPLEIAKILHTTKQTIINYINDGLISSSKYKQISKNHKIEIYSSGIDELIIEKPKYRNLWENRNL